jgi:hypothetical protein
MLTLDLIASWQGEIACLDARNDREWESLDLDLASTQYAYIRFGLLLEKIRNRSFWKYCRQKFSSFKNFCEQKLSIECWQATSYIEAARVAIHLAEAGFSQLPKNFSQAATLIKAYRAHIGPYLERAELVRIWGGIITSNPATKITAATIQKTIDPNWEDRQMAKASKPLLDRARRIAAGKGMSLDEYLGDLMDADEGLDEAPSSEEIEPELIEVLDNLDRKFARLTIVDRCDRVLDSIDSMFRGGIFTKKSTA